MSAPSYAWLFTINGILHAIMTTVMLAIVWIGWRRQRHFGFLLLVGWAILSLFNILGNWLLLPVVQRWLNSTGSASNSYVLTALPSILGGWASTLLLFGGLALLVFRPPTSAPPPAP